MSVGSFSVAPSAGFEPALTAPEADALSPELRGLAGRAYLLGCFAARVLSFGAAGSICQGNSAR